MSIYASLSDQTLQESLKEFSGKGFSDFKPKLVELAVETLNPISCEMRSLLKDTNEIDKILKNGELKAREIAAPVLKDVKSLVGFVN